MARITELSDLFHALASEDWRRARSLAQEIASAHERAGHHSAAARLRGALSSTGPVADEETAVSIPTLFTAPDLLSPLPSATLSEVELTANGRKVVDEIVKEHRYRSRLLAHDLRPRSRLFFYGPPGCGKTLTARALGAALGVPAFVVRFDALVGSYLGQTGIRLREIFRFAESHPSVVLIDEIDAVGRRRGQSTDVGEIDRVVISLMQQLDLVQPATLLVAASNIPDQLDAALIRRFDVVLEFPVPSAEQLRSFVRAHAAQRGLKLTNGLRSDLAAAKTFAEAEKMLEAEHRRTLLRSV